ncbi:hypothetical protein Emed_006856 [Eimeria media]
MQDQTFSSVGRCYLPWRDCVLAGNTRRHPATTASIGDPTKDRQQQQQHRQQQQQEETGEAAAATAREDRRRSSSNRREVPLVLARCPAGSASVGLPLKQ